MLHGELIHRLPRLEVGKILHRDTLVQYDTSVRPMLRLLREGFALHLLNAQERKLVCCGQMLESRLCPAIPDACVRKLFLVDNQGAFHECGYV